MAVQIALLRGVNVGGHAKVAMADLRALLAELGFADAQTLLQSGNLVFRGGKSAAETEQILEPAIAKRFAAKIDVLVRTAKEWTAMIAANPYSDEAKRDPSHLLVMALKEAPGARAVEDLRAAIKGREVVTAIGKHAFIVYPDGIGRSKLTNTLIEARLGTRGTGRNWNTVLKLAELAQGED